MNRTLDKFIGDFIQHDHSEVIQNQTDISSLSGDVEWIHKTIITKTVNYLLVSSDDIIIMNNTTLTATLPTAVGISGKIYTIKNIHTSSVTVDADGTETIDGLLTATIIQYDAIKLISDNANWHII